MVLPERPNYMVSHTFVKWFINRSPTVINMLIEIYLRSKDEGTRFSLIEGINLLRLGASAIETQENEFYKQDEIGEFPLGSIEEPGNPAPDLLGLAIVSEVYNEFKK